MKNQKSVNDLVCESMQYVTEMSYSASSRYHYNWIWRNFNIFAEEQEEYYYSSELGMKFFEYFTGKSLKSNLGREDIYKLRAMKVMEDIYYNRPVHQKYNVCEVYIPNQFKDIIDDYEDYITNKNQKKRTIKTKLSRVLVFLRFLDKYSLVLTGINFRTLELFYKYLSENYAVNAQSNIKFTLRDFLLFLEKYGYAQYEISKMVGTIYSNKHERLPSTYTTVEINKILSSIDRTTIIGKRDYCILLLAVQLGLRCSDICHLKIDNIHPESSYLTYQQQKTGVIENLPTTPLLEYALADYISNVRPVVNSNTLFVKNGANKGAPYSSALPYAILNKYMKIAAIDIVGKRHGPHSLRHSLASNLLKKGVTLPIISGILGHSSSEITTRYLWMDTEQLRRLALEVPYEK